MMNKCETLVVDSGGFLKNAPIGSYCEKAVTLREVVGEIKDRATKERLQVLPYELDFKQPDQDDIVKITEFSKKTGDYPSLSSVDIKVLALTLTLERRAHNGSIDHLRKEPIVNRTLDFYDPKNANSQNDSKIAGFYRPEDEEDDEETEETSESIDERNEEKENAEEKNQNEEIIEKLDYLSVSANPEENEDSESDGVENSEEESGNSSSGAELAEDEEEDDDDDDEGWITPMNIKEKKRLMNGYDPEMEKDQAPVKVACMTTDFAMQNVLKQMGLKVISTDGLLIRDTKTWILRCYACFKTTPDMNRKFCSNCGMKTLKRVSVTVDADGNQRIHINNRYKLNNRGKKFSLPAPKGGKRAVNPVLCEDQQLPQQRKSRAAMARTNALAEDYTAGDSPFALNDVTSKSALLGVKGSNASGTQMYWEKKNPNAVRKNTGNRRKKNK